MTKNSGCNSYKCSIMWDKHYQYGGKEKTDRVIKKKLRISNRIYDSMYAT